MIKGGYILQPRIIDESEAMNFNPTTREVWQFLLRKANHKDNGKFKRGQCFLSLKSIQDGLSWYVGYRKMTYSKPQLTKAIRRLNEGNMIETTKEIRGMYITICNYDYYQDPKNYEGNDNDDTKGTNRSSGGHTKNKNEKNEKKERVRPLVLISIEEREKLKNRYGKSYEWALDELEHHKQKSGQKYKSDYHALTGWVYEKAIEKKKVMVENKPKPEVKYVTVEEMFPEANR
jgi:hypothetical protein